MNETAATPVVSDREQRLCVRCGLCCDGTIFERGRILADDDLAQLEADGFILIATAQGTGFAQPCPHHQNGLCAVYQQGRPQVCHTFRCALLRSVDAGELSWAEALGRIERTVALAGRIQAQLPVQGDNERKSLKQRLASWQEAQTAAGVNVRHTFAPLLLDFVSLSVLSINISVSKLQTSSPKKRAQTIWQHRILNDSPPNKEQIMSDITLESIVRRSSDVMASQVENELVMMDIERGMYYALNPVGADIWERLAEPQQVADLCAQLQQEYAVDRATCEADVLAVLNDMAENGRWRRERVDSPKEVNISIFITQTEGTAKANDSSSVHVQNSRFDKEIRAGVHSAP